jgi:putative GTP pyrophosphokinase
MPPGKRPTSGALDRAALLQRHNIADRDYRKTKLEWPVIQSIRNDHINSKDDLLTAGNAIAATLQRVPAVHSLKVRIKDPDHLVVKIIRKRVEKPNLAPPTVDNYRKVITDLIGIRALHLFKDDWLAIHEFVMQHWHHHEKPTAYIRQGDSQEVTKALRKAGCKVKNHDFGYRSIHYLLKTTPGKDIQLAELQVRTIFEEGWAEIDHQVRYPPAWA